MTRIFSNSNPKIPKSGTFSPKLKGFYFCTKLCNKANSRTMISDMPIVFSNSSPKIEYANQDFWSQIQAFLLFSRNFGSRQIRGVGFKFDNIVFKSQPKNIQIRHFWSQIQAFLFFPKFLQLDKFEGVCIPLPGNAVCNLFVFSYCTANFLTKFSSSDQSFNRNILTSLYLKSKHLRMRNYTVTRLYIQSFTTWCQLETYIEDTIDKWHQQATS